MNPSGLMIGCGKYLGYQMKGVAVSALVIVVSIVLLYALFFLWYSPLRGPLRAAEVEAYVQKLRAKGADPVVLGRLRDFLAHDTGRSFVMINLIRLYDRTPALPGVAEGESSEEVLQRYTSDFLPKLLRRAGHPVLQGRIAAEAVEAWGLPDAERWSAVGLVRYRSRRDMIEAATAADFSASHLFKRAAMEKTIAVPADPWLYAGDPRLILGLVTLIAILLTLLLL